MEAAGTGHVWYAQASRGPTSYPAGYDRTDVIAAKRAAMEAMVRGLARTLRWFAAASPEEIVACIADFFEGGDHALMARGIARYKSVKLWTDTPRFPPEALAQLERGMLSAGAIKRTPGFAGLVAEDVTESALA
jgi:NitT/TauT family transport system substrate-binding protein